MLRPQDGDVLTTDGPFAEGKEHLGGITIIRAPDLEAALEWGGKLARATTLPIEVRPFQQSSARLIFTCAHPALAANVQVALTLRLLGGLTTAEIAHAFLVPEPTMAQRLVRAKG